MVVNFPRCLVASTMTTYFTRNEICVKVYAYVQVHFINLMPMHVFHKLLHTSYCIPASSTR